MLQDAKRNQNRFKLSLNEITKGNPTKKSNEQKNALHNINALYESQEAVIKFCDIILQWYLNQYIMR